MFSHNSGSAAAAIDEWPVVPPLPERYQLARSWQQTIWYGGVITGRGRSLPSQTALFSLEFQRISCPPDQTALKTPEICFTVALFLATYAHSGRERHEQTTTVALAITERDPPHGKLQKSAEVSAKHAHYTLLLTAVWRDWRIVMGKSQTKSNHDVNPRKFPV